MKRLFEYMGQIPTAGDLGIEVEVEGVGLPYVRSKIWRTEGSLRGGLEYVIVGAIPAKDAESALKALKAEFDGAGSILNFSFRTSVHVHLNVQQLTFNQVANCIYTYLLLEEALIHYCGEQRKGNRFCLRASDAENLYNTLENLFRSGEAGYNQIPRNQARYSALNVEAIGKYGSLEFRGMEGNMDIPRLSRWCNALLAIRAYACANDNPMEIYEAFDSMPPEEFLASVLGPLSKAFEFPGLDNRFKRSFSLAIALPFAHKEREDKRKAALKRRNSSSVKGSERLNAILEGFVPFPDDQAREGMLRGMVRAPRIGGVRGGLAV
jgi:hypothetical protein